LHAEKGGIVYSLPKTVITVKGEKEDQKPATYTITPSIVPDQRARYRLRYASSAFTEDELNLGVDSNGLLTTTKADSLRIDTMCL
jgi:hypothetical protein